MNRLAYLTGKRKRAQLQLFRWLYAQPHQVQLLVRNNIDIEAAAPLFEDQPYDTVFDEVADMLLPSLRKRMYELVISR